MTTTLDGRESLYQYLGGFDAGDVGAAVVYAGNQEFVPGTFEPAGTASGLMTAHLSALNPHNQYLLASSFNPAAFDPAGSAAAAASGAASALASHVAAANPHTVYLLSAAYTAADVLAKLLTVDGAASGLDADLLDGLSSLAFVKADGSVTSATAGPQTFTNSIIATAGMRPAADTTSYKWFTKADGTTGIIFVDTTNSRVRFKDLIGWNSIVSGDLVGLDFFRSGFFGSRLRADDANGDLRWFDTTSGTEVERARFNRTGGFSTFGGQATFQSNVMIGAVGDSTAREIIFPKLFNDAIVFRTFRNDASNYADRIALTSGTIAGSGVGIAYLRLRDTWLGVGVETPNNKVDVAGTVQADGLRLDVTPTAETPSATHTVIINLSGTNYKFLCVPA